MYLRGIFLMLVLIAGGSGCTKFVQVGPPQNLITSAATYADNATATSVVRGIYSQMINNTGFASGTSASITARCGLSADELKNYSTDATTQAFYANALSATNFSPVLWQEPYKFINNANAVIEGLSESNGVTAPVKAELTGEAKFIRAFCYFYLVNLFGDVPLITTTNYRVNTLADRSASSLVYTQIIADLHEAQMLLPDDYSAASGERDQPNKWVATALLARVLLYTKDWQGAAMQADAVIENSAMFSLNANLNEIFLKNSSETIWQLKPNGTTINTNEGNMFILISSPELFSLSDPLLAAFEVGDNRRLNWIDSIVVAGTAYYFPFKYKIKTGDDPFNEYSMVLRLAEQYLIRAEARTQTNDLAGAQADVNAIRERAGLGDIYPSNQVEMLAAIAQERRVELFTEWGHRWLDLKRTNQIDSVMAIVAPQKGSHWDSHQQLYPLPQLELINDQHLVQNPGY